MSTAVLVPCHKRPEYTEHCLRSIERAQVYGEDALFYLVDDGSCDKTWDIINSFKLPAHKIKNPEPLGLRQVIIDFFGWVKDLNGDIPIELITKIDNDCAVPANWLKDLTKILRDAKADILSPNVSESNAAHKYGTLHMREGSFIPSEIVGGLWFMRREMIEDIYFEPVKTSGIRAAFHLLNQIVVEKSPRIGWTDTVTYEDIGHWAGTHPLHIKSFEHAHYSADVGRRIAWTPEDVC